MEDVGDLSSPEAPGSFLSAVGPSAWPAAATALVILAAALVVWNYSGVAFADGVPILALPLTLLGSAVGFWTLLAISFRGHRERRRWFQETYGDAYTRLQAQGEKGLGKKDRERLRLLLENLSTGQFRSERQRTWAKTLYRLGFVFFVLAATVAGAILLTLWKHPDGGEELFFMSVTRWMFTNTLGALVYLLWAVLLFVTGRSSRREARRRTQLMMDEVETLTDRARRDRTRSKVHTSASRRRPKGSAKAA